VNLGRREEAVEAYKQATRLMPDNADAHFFLALTYVMLQRHPEAVESFKEAIRLKPEYAGTLHV
jgi:cytochrome c-type biogenesis protein CcmH/NrfG